MSRKTKYLIQKGIVLHAFNVGIEPPSLSYASEQGLSTPMIENGRLLFRSPRDYNTATELLLDAREVANVSVLLHALLPDRIDLVLLQHEPYASSLFMQRACQPLSCLLNRRLKRSGHYFHARFGIKPVASAAALLALSHTIHMGPVDAGLVLHAAEWPYSSCKACLDGMTPGLSDPSAIISLVGGKERYGQFLHQFARANPSSAELFLCPEYRTVWKAMTRANQRQRRNR